MRRVDLAEESYFNTDDEEDEDDADVPGPHPAPTSPTLPSPLLSPPLSRFQFAQKRRRQRTPGIPLRTGGGGGTQRVPAPATPIHLPRTPPINALVDYRDDDEPSSDPEDALLESLVSANKPASPSSASTVTTTPAPLPPTPIAIATTTTTTIASTGTSGGGGGGFVPLRAEKRRRAEEDEDEMGLERLVGGKSRRPAKVAAAAGTGEEGPKRIRLRFGAAGLAAAAASTLPAAARSEPGTKDGDTG